jgi:hypothetical protein
VSKRRGWTFKTFKKYVDAVLLERKQHASDMLIERDKAIKEFKDQTDAKFASRNEIQTAMKDASVANERATATLVSTLMPRAEATILIERNAADIKEVADRLNEQGGHGRGIKDSWGWLAAIIALGIALYEAWHK